jgi:hypothetical protein
MKVTFSKQGYEVEFECVLLIPIIDRHPFFFIDQTCM